MPKGYAGVELAAAVHGTAGFLFEDTLGVPQVLEAGSGGQF